jgi:uncharacterized cupin superfamily protein
MSSFNLDRAGLRDLGSPEGFRMREAEIGPAIGAEHLAGSILEIPPGERAWPYHWEAAQEEWVIVLAGTPTLRTPEGEEALAPGDVVCFPVGPDGAHQLRNDAGEPSRVVMLSDVAMTNVVVYPDSGKVGTRTPWVHGDFPESASVPYWEGE